MRNKYKLNHIFNNSIYNFNKINYYDYWKQNDKQN